MDDRRSKSREFLKSWLGKKIEVALKDSELIRRKLTGKIVFIGKNSFFQRFDTNKSSEMVVRKK